MTDSDLSKYNDGNTPQVIRSSDRDQLVWLGRKQQYGLEPIPKEMTDSDLSKYNDGNTPQVIRSSDQDELVWLGRKQQYGLEPIPKKLTESDLSKHSAWKDSDEKESGKTPQLSRSSDRNLSVRAARKTQYSLDHSQSTMISSIRKECWTPETEGKTGIDVHTQKIYAHQYQSPARDKSAGSLLHTTSLKAPRTDYRRKMEHYLKRYYSKSAHFKKYLVHDFKRTNMICFALVPNLMIIGRQASKEATSSIRVALSKCPHRHNYCTSYESNLNYHTTLLLAEETAIPGNYLVLTWLHNLLSCRRKPLWDVDVPCRCRYDQTDNMKFMSQFEGVFLLEVAEGDDVSDLQKMMSKRFRIKVDFNEHEILIIFECNHKDPNKLRALFNTVSTTRCDKCTIIIISNVDKVGVDSSKLNADRTLVADGIESLQIRALSKKRLITTNDGEVISKHISQIVSKRKTNLWGKDKIEKVSLENLKTVDFLNVFIRLPDEVRSINMQTCDPTIHLVHSADILDVSCHSSFLFNPVPVLSSTLTTISLCFAAKSHIFRERIYKIFANGFSQTAQITSLFLRNMKVGKKVLTIKLEKNEIEQMKLSMKTNEDYRRYGARILGPKLQKETFDQKDIDDDLKHSDSFAAYVMLDLICYNLVKTNDAITECYPAMRNQCEIVLVCFLNKHIDIASFKGFPLVKRDNSFVSKESLRAENSFNREESTFITTANREFVAINETVSYHADNLMESHRNLEAVKVSYVKSTNGQYEHPHPCIVLYCKAKGYIPYGEDSFPKRLNHPFQDKTYDTDVREGFFTSCPYLTSRSTDLNEELALGCSIGEINTNIAATLGPFVNIKETGETCFLTVRHLFTPLPPARNDSQIVGVKVVQPADIHLPPTVSAIPDRACGEVLSSHIGGQIDAALVKICPKRLPTRGRFVNITKEDLNFAGLSLTEPPTYDDGAYMDAKTLTAKDFATRRIMKIGNTTSLTKGTLSTTDGIVRETMDYTTLEALYNGSRQKYVVQSQLLVDSYVKKIFCQAGDSGSAVFLVDDDNRLHCIGMVIGMLVNDCTAVITPIKNILDILGHKLGKTLELKRFEFDQMDEH